VTELQTLIELVDQFGGGKRGSAVMVGHIARSQQCIRHAHIIRENVELRCNRR
jgi:hypothetical protein